MNVLFLGAGDNRRVGLALEARWVVESGGRAVALVGRTSPWKRDRIDSRVKLIEVAAIEAEHRPVRLAHKLLVRGPQKLLGKGGRIGARLSDAYTTRVAEPVHTKLVLRAYRMLLRRKRLDLIVSRALAGQRYDYVIVYDGASIPIAELIADLRGIPVRYSLGFVDAASSVDPERVPAA